MVILITVIKYLYCDKMHNSSYLSLACFFSSLNFLCSFQSRIDDCMRQMASLLYQIKGPVNANTRNQVEADSDNMLRPLMDFLDAKWAKLSSPVQKPLLLYLKPVLICVCVCVCEQSDAVCLGVWENCAEASAEGAVENCDEQSWEDHHPSSGQWHLCKTCMTRWILNTLSFFPDKTA